MNMWDIIIEPFSYQFMINAMLIAVLVGGVCAFISVFLMVKGWSLLGDATSHSVVPGVAVAYLFGLPLLFGAFIAGGLASFGIWFFNTRLPLKPEVAIGFIYTSFMALGMFIISVFPMQISIESVLLGNLLSMDDETSWQLIIACLVSVLILSLKSKDLLVVLFDECHAQTIGLNKIYLKILFFAIVCACVVSAMHLVGSFLVVSLIITPGAIAYLYCHKIKQMMILAISIGVITSFFGVYSSFIFDTVAGAIIVLYQCALFVFAFIFAPKMGLLYKYKFTLKPAKIVMGKLQYAIRMNNNG